MNASSKSPNAKTGFLAIDVGSSRVKLGWFPPSGECTSESKSKTVSPKVMSLPIAAPQLPQPEVTLAVSHAEGEMKSEICAWLEEHGASESPRFVASVHPAATKLVQGVFADTQRILTADDLPMKVNVEHPERVGIDRLLSAVAVNRLRQPGRSAIVVDLGTACTVDLISPDGVFEGGAILPGTTLSASALHSGTATLPQLATENFDSPPAVVGKSTPAAISSGLYWGLVGAVRELVDRIAAECQESPQLFLTGGEASRLVTHLTSDAQPFRYLPNLVLSGIALVAEERS